VASYCLFIVPKQVCMEVS